MDRVQLKLEGKRNFKKNYGRSVGACLVPFIPVFAMVITFVVWFMSIIIPIMRELSKYYNSYTYRYSYNYNYIYHSNFDLLEDRFLNALLGFFIVLVIVAFVVGLILIILKVMLNRFFLMNRKQPSCKVFSTMFSFKGSEYFNVFCGMFLKSLYEFLWTCLFIIPGIIKSFAYFMVPYILAENPNIGANRAITISKQTMKGAKGDLFVFYLSFIGWFLLCGIVYVGPIVSIFYVAPYFEAAKAEFYVNMKRKAKKMKICDANELA